MSRWLNSASCAGLAAVLLLGTQARAAESLFPKAPETLITSPAQAPAPKPVEPLFPPLLPGQTAPQPVEPLFPPLPQGEAAQPVEPLFPPIPAGPGGEGFAPSSSQTRPVRPADPLFPPLPQSEPARPLEPLLPPRQDPAGQADDRPFPAAFEADGPDPEADLFPDELQDMDADTIKKLFPHLHEITSPAYEPQGPASKPGRRQSSKSAGKKHQQRALERPSVKTALQTPAKEQPKFDANAARQVFNGNAATYWQMISEKRHQRAIKRRDHQQIALSDYVLTQPPSHAERTSMRSPDDEEESTRSPDIPVMADFLRAAAKEFNFVPDRAASELTFKRTYVRFALSAGLTRDQIVRIYAFETGGNGTYDTQAGLEFHRPGEHAISRAIGYNQLLGTNSVELLAQHGDQYLESLKQMADRLSGEAKNKMLHKIEAIRRMLAFARSVPDVWNEHNNLAKNTEGGKGIHALIYDRDIGPMLQTQKLLDSLVFAHKKGYNAQLGAAELELMNLTGDGNGLDMVLMPPALRAQVPTANFFQPDGYERNSIARRAGTVANLIALIDQQMERNARLPGARELASAR